MENVSIIGAGLSGLIAATQFPTAQVYEANGPDAVQHRAVLRFRSDKLSRLIGIPFQKVTVRKSIFSGGAHRAPCVDLANLYSRKTNGGYLDRSIWNTEAVERFIAPEDIQLQLADSVASRIHWNAPVTPDCIDGNPIISTMPMPVLLKMLRHRDESMITALDDSYFQFASIRVDRFRIAGANVYQTVYYPDHDTSIYRASMTGSLLIVESVEGWDYEAACQSGGKAKDETLRMVCRSFGILQRDLEDIELGHRQRFGKIAPIDDRLRRQLIYDATVKHGVYSLGRFATWRNILLDDVVDDAAIIRRMITHGHYGATLQHHKAAKE